MARKPRARTDPLEGEIELALNPGSFIPSRACFSFVADLDGVAAMIAKLTQTDPVRAISLYETFLAGCYEKAEEQDDSSGGFGQFVGELFCGWIQARQAAGTDPGETATRLLAWMDDDPYGFCQHLEKNAARVFSKAGLAAFEKQIRARFEAATAAKPAPEGAFGDRPEYLSQRWGEMLRMLYLEQKNAAAYIALAEETGPTDQDCCNVATLLASRRKPGEALAWVERGLDLDQKTPHGTMAGYDLGKLKRNLLTRLGRGGEALEAAWAEYREHPCIYTYDDLMKFVPRAERPAWHEKALDAGPRADLASLIELLLETRETERLAELMRRTTNEALEQVSHYTTGPAAKKLEKPHPDLAARLWRAQGMRIINAKKSKFYDAARSNFERAMRCYQKAGLSAEWEKTVSRVRTGHHRKAGFMPGFEELVAGSAPSDQPSFLERARTRWGKRLEQEDR